MNFVQPIREEDKISEVRQFLAAKSPRNELLFCFGVYTGLRISDILRIKVKDVQGRDHFTIIEQKTSKARRKRKSNKQPVKRRIPIGSKLKRLITNYCEGKDSNEYLFKSRQGKNQPITRIRAYDILREAACNCGLEEIGTHTLRKTFGYHMYHLNENNIALLMNIYGHTKEHITLRYIGVNQDAIEDAYAALNDNLNF